MTKDFYIKLTLAVYRVTELFPKNETLKHDIRNLANEVLANLIINNLKDCSRNIKALKDLFSLVKEQNWVDSRNFFVLHREYDKIERSINTGKPVEKPRTTKNRKEKILETFQENKKIKIGDLTKIFPSINRRTLLRDLENFSQAGLIVKNGNGRGSCYILKNATL